MQRVINIREVTKEYMENRYFKNIFNEICESILWFLTFYPIVAIVNYNNTKDINSVIKGLIVIIPIMIAVIIKRKLQLAWQSFLFYGIVYTISAIIFYLVLGSWSYGIFLITWLIKDIKKSKKIEKVKFNKNSIIAIETILAFSILVCATLKLNEIRKIIFILAIIVGIASIAYLHKIRSDRLFMQDSIKRNVVSVSNKYGKNIIIFICIIGLIIVMFLMGSLGIFNKAASITDTIANTLTNGFDKVPMESQEANESEELGNNSFEAIKNDANEPSGIVKVIFMVLRFILSIITFMLKIFIVIALMSMIYLVFNFLILKLKTKNDNDKIEYIYNSGKKEEKISERLRKYKDEIKELITYDNKKEIRKLYKKKVLKYKGKSIIIRNVFTVGDINKEIKRNTEDNIDNISAIYEKARYSNEDISNLEVSELKKKL